MTQTPNHPKPRVLVVENDARTAAMHKQNLERWGYQPILATGVGEALLSDAQAKAEEHACHIALVDMHLLDDYDKRDKSGLSLPPKLKPALSIIISGSGNNRETVLEAINKGAVDFIGKEEPLARLQGALARAKQQICFAEGDLSIDIAEPLLAQIMSSLAPGKPEQVRDVLRALFPEAHAIRVGLLDASTHTSSVNLRRESYVLKVWPDNLQPFAVKLANPERIQQEVRNYTDYIEHRLEHNYYAKILGTVGRWHIGGISYEFFGGGLNDFTLFSNYYGQHTVEELCITINHLFEHVWSRYTSQPRRAKEHSLFNQYSLRWNRGKWLEWLDTYIRTLGSDLHQYEPIGKFLDPVCWARKHTGNFGRDTNLDNDDTTKLGMLSEAIGHGDLHGDNFFIDEQQQVWITDYKRTGYGPVFQDFVQLEIDLLTRIVQLQPDRINLFYELCLMVASSRRTGESIKPTEKIWREPEARKLYSVIQHLRRLARKIIASSDMREYLWGLLLTAVYNLSTDGMNEANDSILASNDRLKLLAIILYQRLETWTESTWPPANLPQVSWLTKHDQDRLIQTGNDLRSQLNIAKARSRNYKDTPSTALQQEIDRLQKQLHELGETFEVA